MLKWNLPEVDRGEIPKICRLCLEKHKKCFEAKSLDSFLYFVLPDLDLSLSEDPQICCKCIQQLTDSYIFKTRCIYNQDQILKLQNLLQRSVYLQEVVQGIDFHKENEQTYQVVYNSLKTLLGPEFDSNTSSSHRSESDANMKEEDDTVPEELIEYCCEEEVGDGKKGFSYIGFGQPQNKNEFVTKKHILIEHSRLMELGKVEMNYSEQRPHELECKSPVQQKPEPTSGKPFQCNFCYKLFTQKLHYDGHLLNKHKDVPKIEELISCRIHYCEYCVYRTVNSYNLSSHIVAKHGKKQSGINLVKCEICGYCTHNKGNFVTHMRRHDKVRPFSCKMCRRRFGQKINLDSHYLNSHAHEENVDLLISSKIYACSTCNFRAVDKGKYAKHVAKQHMENDSEFKILG